MQAGLAPQGDSIDSDERGDSKVGTAPKQARDAPELPVRASSAPEFSAKREAANSTSLTPLWATYHKYAL
jgi:hypothetical protein